MPADITGFRIQRSTDGQTFTTYATLEGSGHTYFIDDDDADPSVSGPGLPPGSRFFYRVRAIGGATGGTSYTPKKGGNTVMPAPSNVGATAVSSTQADIVWTETTLNETRFDIEVNDGTSTFVIQNVPPNSAQGTASFMVSGLAPNTTYTFRVRAWGPAMDSMWSLPSNSITTPPTVSIAAPSGLNVVMVSPTRFTLTWQDNATNELGFKIERRFEGSDTWTQIGGGVGANVSTWSNYGVSAEWGVHYRVRAYGAAGHSAYTNVDSVYVPGGVTWEPDGHNEYDVSWGYYQDDVEEFIVERAVIGVHGTPEFDHPFSNDFEEIARVSGSARSFDATGVADAQSYQYRITAIHEDGGLGWGTYPWDLVTPTPPRAPENFTVTTPYAYNAALSWTDTSTGNDGVEIRTYDSTGALWRTERVPAPSLDRYTVTGLSPNQTNQFEVLNYWEYGFPTNPRIYSDPSPRVTRTMPSNPSSPVSVSVTATGSVNETGTQTAQITVSRSASNITNPLTVDLYPTFGTARSGTDFVPIPTNVTIDANAYSTSFTIQGNSDWLVEGQEVILVGIAPSPNYYVYWNGVGTNSLKSLNLTDNGPTISSVVWEAIDSPITVNPGTGHPGSAVGYRIFPDYISYEDTVDRRRVRVKATTSPPTPGVPIYFKLIDVDNPSYKEAPVDDESLEFDNLGEAFLSSDYAVTDSNGVASVVVTVSVAPLDNYVVVAGHQNYLSLLRNVDQNGDGLNVFQYLGNQWGPAAPALQMAAALQVFRILHVEVDSMGYFGPGVIFDPDDEPPGWTPQDPGVRNPDWSAFAEAFKPAGVQVVQDVANSENDLPFEYDFESRQALEDYFSEHRQGRTKEGFFSVYVGGAYERGFNPLPPPEPGSGLPPDILDNDPVDTEGGAAGISLPNPPADKKYAIVFEEILRDMAGQHGWSAEEKTHAAKWVAVHEVGHYFQPLHSNLVVEGNPNDIMWAPWTDAGEDKIPTVPLQFSAFDIYQIERKLGLAE